MIHIFESTAHYRVKYRGNSKWDTDKQRNIEEYIFSLTSGGTQTARVSLFRILRYMSEISAVDGILFLLLTGLKNDIKQFNSSVSLETMSLIFWIIQSPYCEHIQSNQAEPQLCPKSIPILSRF